MTEVRAAIDTTPAGGTASLFVPPGLVLLLEGADVVVGSQIHLQILSTGEGATIDAQRLSRVFDVQSGARLSLRLITLANGHSSSEGGALRINNGSALLSCASIMGSYADVRGGAILVDAGHVMLTDRSAVVDSVADAHPTASNRLGSGSSGGGGALAVVGGAVAVMTSGSTIKNATNSYGGAIFISDSVALVDSSSICDCLGKYGGAV
jgi:hypothetical protein